MSTAEHAPPEALRQFLRSGQEDAPKILPGLLARAWAVLSRPATPGQPAAQAGECAFLLAVLLRSQRDQALAVRLLQTLASAGRFARALASLHIQARTLPLPQLSPLLTALPGHDFLALLNEMLLDSPADDKQFAAWLKSLLPAPGRLDAREALLFLKALAAEEVPLARPLRDALVAAGLGEGIRRAFAGNPSPTTAEVLLQATEALAWPPVQAEALAYTLRAAGADGPSRLGPLLAAQPELAERETALAAEMRRLALRPEAMSLLLGAAQTEPEVLGLVLANLLRGGGELTATALGLMPLLPRQGVQSCLNDLPHGAHGTIHARLAQSMAALEPELLRRAAKALAPSLGLDDAATKALAEMLAARPGQGQSSPQDTTAWKTGPAQAAGPSSPPPKTAQNRRSSLAETVKDALGPLKDLEFSHSTLASTTLEGLNCSASDLSRCRFSGVTFRRLRISSVNMAACAADSCVFQGCAFVGVDFSHGQFSGCRFEACSFEFCDLSRTQFSGCALSGCSLAESSLAGASLIKTRLESSTLRTCTLAGARLQECSLARLAFARTELSGCLWERTVCRDAELLACTLSGMRVLGCDCQDLLLARCSCPGLVVLGGHTDNPHLAKAERTTRILCLEGACTDLPPLPPALLSGCGAAFVQACVERYLRVNEAQSALAAMRGQDQRRRHLAFERLSEGQGQFLKLLPALLSTDVFERAQQLPEVPACTIGGHLRPGLLSREVGALLERHFPGLAPTQKSVAQLSLDAVYAIGSLGSVAQKPSSDADCWVCYTPATGLEPMAVRAACAGLSRKLAALEAWAWQQFELEVHFFLMHMDDVRQNDFGMSDKESSGSAQAALLKEEFYRTALKLAGKDLLWWAAPPAATQAEAEELLGLICQLDPRTGTELVDLGQPMPIPQGEYFGACLWQIVKALHSPYKSVMKLGLLEKYAGQGQDMRLLCDRIKEAVRRGRRLAQDVDPYLSLFTSIRKHYRALADTTSLALIGECLRLKADVAPEDLPPEFDHWAGAAKPDAAKPVPADPGTFASALRLGGMVNLFMVSAYRRIQEGIRAGKNAAHISPEDLTRLGRRIAANFAQHPSKVGLVPFLSEDMTFTELYFYAEKAPGKRTIWAIKGKDKASGKAAVETLAPIRRDTDVVRLLSWLLFNGLYDPKQVVHAEKTLAPIALLDLQALLADLAAYFPRRATLEPDLDEYLKPERVAKGFLIANLPVPPDKNKLHSLSVIYATNWGEVFCQSFDNPPLSPQKSTLAYLREVLAKPVTQSFPLKVFTPRKSACPKIRLD